MIESDRRVDLFEYALSRMIQRHLARHFDRVGPTPVKFRSLRVLLPDARILLSTLARVGSRSEEEAAQALHEARDSALKQDPKLTLTRLYNKRPTWLAQRHANLDRAVLAAYGWPEDLHEDEILARLLALNAERHAEQGS